MYTLINGSQKNKDSNSLHFLNSLSEYLEEYTIMDLKKDSFFDVLSTINISDTIVFAFPLYVDSPTSVTLNFFDYIYDNNIDLDNKKVYFIINCGFREGEQNLTALNVVKRWCEKVNLNYMGSILIGAGEIVGKDSYKFISKKARRKLHNFSVCVSNKKHIELITTLDFISSKLYCVLANHSWNTKGRKNKLTRKLIQNE